MDKIIVDRSQRDERRTVDWTVARTRTLRLGSAFSSTRQSSRPAACGRPARQYRPGRATLILTGSLCSDLRDQQALLHTLHGLLRKRNYVSYVTYVVRHLHATG